MSMRTERIKTDVLIIGGGTAGCFAAYVIGQKSNKKVLIAEKANIKRSGRIMWTMQKRMPTES